MNFINTTVDVKQLPAAEELALHPVHPAYKKVLQIEWCITMLVLAAVCIVLFLVVPFVQKPSGWLLLTAAFFLTGGIYYFLLQKSFPFLAFALREKDVVFQNGWLFRSVKLCPFNRIQNCSVNSGPLERKHGLASLIIYTAGSAGADFRIPGLLQQEADQLRHFILEKIHLEPDADH